MIEQLIEFINKGLEIDIRKNTRKEEYIMGRALYYKILRDFSDLSYKNIGKPLKKNHATVLHSLENAWPTAVKYKRIRLIYENYKTFFENQEGEIEIPLGDMNPVFIKEIEEKDKVINRLINEKNRFDKLLSTVNEDKIDIVYTRLEAMIKMINSAENYKKKNKQELEGALL